MEAYTRSHSQSSAPAQLRGAESSSSLNSDDSSTMSQQAKQSDLRCFGTFLAELMLGEGSSEDRFMTASPVYNAIFRLGHLFLQKDIGKMRQCMQDLGMHEAVCLYGTTKAAAQESAAAAAAAAPEKPMARSYTMPHNQMAMLSPPPGDHNDLPDARFSQSVRGYNKVTYHAMDREFNQGLVRRMIVDFMKEVEAYAFQYFSDHWDRAEELVAVNARAARKLGLRHGRHHVPGAGQRREKSSPELHSSDLAADSSGEVEGAEAGIDAWRIRARANWHRGFRAIGKKVTMDMLGVTRKSKTLTEVFASLMRPGSSLADVVENKRSGILDSSVLEKPREDTGRQPVLLILGGGMAAGKSTVREIIGKSDFWSKVAPDAVVVEADAIKECDHLFRHLRGGRTNYRDDKDARKIAHEYSTQAAEAILVAAINEQKDVIFDGTMTWAPFVEQTIAMARDFEHAYVCGPGYVPAQPGGTAGVERYYEPLPEKEQETFSKRHSTRRPYRIEMIGVTCDPGLAVCRGIWRWLSVGRGVPISAQLRSHRLFAENFERYTRKVDSATLYFTGAALTTFNKGHMDTSPQVIAHCSSATRDELLLNNTAFNTFKQLRMLNELAESRETLFNFPVAVAGGPLAGRYEGMTRVAGADNGADVPRVVGRAHAGGAEGEKHYIPTSDPARKQGLQAVFRKLDAGFWQRTILHTAPSSHPLCGKEAADMCVIEEGPSPFQLRQRSAEQPGSPSIYAHRSVPVVPTLTSAGGSGTLR
eukprot:jgi/Tetstr1/466339/TSEL_010869.t1